MQTPLPTKRPSRAHRWLLAGGLGLATLLGARAQTALSGAYTINDAQTTAGTNFNSFKDAATALNAGGVSGPVTFTVSGGPYTEQFSLNQLTGSSATNRVTFNGGGRTIQFGSSNSAQRAVITLNGADYVTINNLLVDATVGGTSTTTYGWGVQLLNNADNNVLSNCTVTASTAAASTSTNFAGIVSNASTTFPTTTGATASQNLTLQNNTVVGGYYGIAVVGSGSLTAPTPGVQITGNTVRDCYDAGIYIGYLSGAQVTGNDVSRPARTGAGSFYGININTGTSGATVAKNRFHQAFPAGTTTTSGAYGIYLFTLAAATPTTPNVIANNLIYDLSGSAVYGIFNGSSDNAKYYYNTVDINDQANTGTGGGFGFYQTTGLNVEFRNNIVRLSRTGTGLNYAILVSSVGSTFVSNNNDLVGSGSTYRTGFYQTTAYATLTDWSQANGGAFDQNSLSVEPQFVSVVTGNLRPTAVALNGTAAPVAAVPDDFTGATRSSTAPDLGAYEFTPPANTPGVVLRSIDSPAPPVTTGSRTVTVTVLNNGTVPLTTVQLAYVLNNAPAVTQTLTPAGGLAVGATQSFSFTTPATLISGRNALTVTASAPNGSTATSSLSRTFYTPMVGTYTINKQVAGSATNFTSFAEAATTLNSAGIAGSVRLNVLNGPYTEQFSLGQVAGVSATDTIVVDGGAARQRLAYTGTSGQPAAVLLNGTDYVTLQNLTIDLASSAQYGIGVNLIGQAVNNRIKGCVILAPAAATLTTANAGIAVSGALVTTSSPGDATNLRIENDSIAGGAYGISLTGISTSSRTTGVRITGTTVRDFYNYGILLTNYAGCQIVGNNIHREGRGSTITFYGVYVTGSVGTAIERNRIHDTQTSASSSLPAYGVYFSGTSGAAGTENDVVNNLFYNFNTSGTINVLYNSASSYARYYHNTIVLNSSVASTSGIVGFYQTGVTTNIDFRNNLVSITQTGAQGRYALNVDTNTSAFTSDYNDLYVGTGTAAVTSRYGNTNYVTLADWRAANSGAFDQNSVAADPAFLNAGSFVPTAAALNGAGTAATLPRVPRDFAGALRTSPPDIGAYEFGVVLNDVELVSIDAPTSPLTAGNNPITVTVRNLGSSVLTSLVLSYTLNGGAPVAQTFTGASVAFGATQQFTFTQGLTLPFGTYTLAVTASQPNGVADPTPANNTRSTTLQQPIPNNDEPCGALPLTAGLATTNANSTFTNLASIITPACSPAVSPKDVWFTWTPTATSAPLYLSGAPAGMVRVFTATTCTTGFAQVFCQSSGAANTAVGNVTVTGLTPGRLHYVAVSGYASGDATGAFSIGLSPLANRPQVASTALTVFPNPGTAGASVTLRLEKALGTGTITFINALGQVVRQQPLANAAEQAVGIQGLPAGLYTLRVQAGSQTLTHKLQLLP
ncbi:beta strand repeat-containing protein [Hymenobacter properus]|uniref:Right-handed parallel beta-helix repeat-containing protein n=1 Tax=Hymenobacter properus TaxID=2791026 RepID=A0A931FLN3_9BACT|nr:right-handed parallel beta-helix repeat-containing protein [Hymenobacter properus]MBF9143055.1 right-handed parallel beta-helix repeat-containing protein [Hymenobacter properus]MBR7721863.1 right-handed parallel beta-helix repeat-containing protein [Microvirga sp. SRT04]